MAAMLQNSRVAVSKRIEEFEPIARSRAGGITFSLVTSDSLHKVLSPAFLTGSRPLACASLTASRLMPTAKAWASARCC